MNKMSAAESDTRADATERWRGGAAIIRPTIRVVLRGFGEPDTA